jgi:hypothetical protein
MSLHARAKLARRICAPGRGSRWIPARGLSAQPAAEASRESPKPLEPAQQVSRPPPRPPLPRVDERGPLNWRSVAVILGVGTIGLAYYANEKQRRMDGACRQHRRPDSTRTRVAAWPLSLKFPHASGLAFICPRPAADGFLTRSFVSFSLLHLPRTRCFVIC